MTWRQADDDRLATVLVEPSANLARVEPDEVTPLDERDASLGDETPDVPRLNAEVACEGGHVEQCRQLELRPVLAWFIQVRSSGAALACSVGTRHVPPMRVADPERDALSVSLTDLGRSASATEVCNDHAGGCVDAPASALEESRD